MNGHQTPIRISANIGIVAGHGSLPKELAEYLRAIGHEPFLIGIESENVPWIGEYQHQVFAWGELGQFFKYLKKNNIKQVLFAGGMTRPVLKFKNMDWGGILSLSQVLAFMIGGDNSLLTGLIKLFAKNGVEVVGAHEIMPTLLATSGAIVGRKPPRKSMKNIEKAFEACKKLGELDIGQAAVAVGGRVVAVEGIEGTDGMLERIATMRSSGRLYESGQFGVLVKTMKPGQDMRVDLPAIGPKTIDGIVRAGLRGVAIEGGHSLILERNNTLQAAKKNGVFVYGLEQNYAGAEE